jgi:uncharacterized sporulation protein YeaH/YhbH (DUF444 family)
MENDMSNKSTPPKTPGGDEISSERPSVDIKAGDIWPPVAEKDLVFCPAPPPVPRATVRSPGQFAWFRGPADAARYVERSKRKKPVTVDDILNNRIFELDLERLSTQVSGDTQWKFIFGRDRKGGGGGGKGPGGQGNSDSENDFDIEVDTNEAEEELFRRLELPRLIRKRSTETEMVGLRISGLDKTGARADLARKDTIREYFKRATAAVAADPEFVPDPESNLLVPVDKLALAKRDFRYWQCEEIRQPITKATVYLLIDRSGSVTKEMLDLSFLFNSLLVRFLMKQYKHLRLVFLGHTDGAPKEYATWDEMITDRWSGGTVFSPSLRWILDHAQGNGYLATDNCYLFQGSDGDNIVSDTQPSLAAYRALLDAGFAFIAYQETPMLPGRWAEGGMSLRTLGSPYAERIHVGSLSTRGDVLREFVRTLSKNAISE